MFNKNIVKIFYVTGTVLSPNDIAMNEAEQRAALKELKFERERETIASKLKNAHGFWLAVPLWSTRREDLTLSPVWVWEGASGGGAGSGGFNSPLMLPAEVSGQEPLVPGSRAEPGARPTLALAFITLTATQVHPAQRALSPLQTKGYFVLWSAAAPVMAVWLGLGKDHLILPG